ncbi:hypothetical protein [Salipiger abyssi]|uniref:hypothetical protein n=1 Tax=Salipiger abyssi TaxID=1250539 RepID=UPI001A8F0436|nr:hypothetical protein [Salipiger abyssi]MBN9885943.1 hypothetical protein [Salipiger abyssi]
MTEDREPASSSDAATDDDPQLVLRSAASDAGGESNREDQPELPIPPEVLESLPEPMRHQVRETFGILSAGPARNPVAEKVTPEHISQLIANDEADSVREYEERASSRRYTLVYVVLAILAFFVLAFTFAKDNPDLFKQILAFFATFGAGFGAGWGFTAAKQGAE